MFKIFVTTNSKATRIVVVDEEFVGIAIFTMRKNSIDRCSRISPSKNETYFSYYTVKDVSILFFELISPNGQTLNVSVLKYFFYC